MELKLTDLKPYSYYYGFLNNGKFFEAKLISSRAGILRFDSFTCNYLDISEIRMIDFRDYV